MTRLLAASLVFMLVSCTSWAQDSPIVNRLDVHPDWLFQPDRGSGPSPPDTLDPWRYYPLAVGNAWESRNVDGETFRIDISRDSLVSGYRFFRSENVWYDDKSNIILSFYVYIRFDTTSTYIVQADPLNTPYAGVPCKLNGQPGPVECDYVMMGSVDWMTYEGVLEFSDTTVVDVPVKQYSSPNGWWRYSADFGEVWGWDHDPRPPRGLTFARVDGQEYGSELYPYTVSNEAEPSYERELAIEALWPNPARSSVSVQLNVPAVMQTRLVVFDLLGREVLVWEGMVSSQRESIELDLGTLSASSYIVRMIAANQISNGVLFTRID